MKGMPKTLLVLSVLLFGLYGFGTRMGISVKTLLFDAPGACHVLSSSELREDLAHRDDFSRAVFEDGFVLNHKTIHPTRTGRFVNFKVLNRIPFHKNLQSSAPVFLLIKCGLVTSAYTVHDYSNCLLLETSGLRASTSRLFALESIRR